jgi:hypothetical protein
MVRVCVGTFFHTDSHPHRDARAAPHVVAVCCGRCGRWDICGAACLRGVWVFDWSFLESAGFGTVDERMRERAQELSVILALSV